MGPAELIRQLTSQQAAEDMATAIDDPNVQAASGWNLAHWTCKRVPGAIFYFHHDDQGQATSVVVALNTPTTPPAELTQALNQRTLPITIVVVS
jgi:hypothetical protein